MEPNIDNFLIVGSGFLCLVLIVHLIILFKNYIAQQSLGDLNLFARRIEPLEFLHKGVKFSSIFDLMSRRRHGRISLSTDIANDVQIKFTKENIFDRFSKDMEITSEVQSGDPVFDKLVYVSSDSPDSARAFVFQSKLREIILALFALDIESIEISNKFITVIWNPAVPMHFTRKKIESACDLMLAVCAVPLDLDALVSKPKRSLDYIVVIPALLFFLGLGVFKLGNTLFPPLDVTQIFLDYMFLIITSVLLYLGWSYRMLRGRSSAYTDLLFILFFLLVGFPSFIVGNVIVFNAVLTPSELQSSQRNHIKHGGLGYEWRDKTHLLNLNF